MNTDYVSKEDRFSLKSSFKTIFLLCFDFKKSIVTQDSNNNAIDNS